MRILNWSELDAQQQQQVLTRPAMSNSADISRTVSQILGRIRAEGDVALREFTTRFDKVTGGELRLSAEAIAKACQRVSPTMKAAIAHARDNIACFHQAQKPTTLSLDTQPGVRCELNFQQINRVA